MDTTSNSRAQVPLLIGRHIVGWALASLASPLIYRSQNSVDAWLGTLVPVLAFSAIVFALYALFFTARAQAAWPRSFITLTWVLLLLVLVGQYMDTRRVAQTVHQPHPPVAPVPPPPLETNPFSDPNFGASAAPAAHPYQAPSPPPQGAQQAAEAEHARRIYSAHPDADSIFESPEFHAWLSRNNRFQHTPSHGTTDEIILMFSAYKARNKAEEKRLTEAAQRRNEAAADALSRQYAPAYPR